jgi:phospho-N-acetylmuramoyl-pentapeptide-transferase
VLYTLLIPLRDTVWGGFNLFQYITFRAAMAAITAFLFGTLLGPWIIAALKRRAIIEDVNNPDAPALDALRNGKKNVPTMGGIIIVPAIMVSVVLWARPVLYVFLGMLVVGVLGTLGLVDDYFKLTKRGKRGLNKTQKILVQTGLAVIVCVILYWVMKDLRWGTHFVLPFIKSVDWQMGYFFFMLIGVVVIVGASNAVNLTDGLDGLAIGSTVMATLAFIAISYVVGDSGLAGHLKIPYIPDAGELSVFCAAITGAGLAFLWFNCHPAQVFMGDTGSLSLGGALGYVAVVTRSEILLFMVGGVFVAEALSVILQVASFRMTGKRIFRMTPLHHHFQLGERKWDETKIVVRFLIIGAILSAFAVATLKIR